jgi:hypothetical protein
MKYEKAKIQLKKKFTISIGDKFERLTVIETPATYLSERGKPYTMCLCQCSCGKVVLVNLRSLQRGHTKSCGCFRSDFAKRERLTKSTQLNNDKKRCSSCLEFKTGNDFFKDRRNKDGLTVACKACHYFTSIKRKYGLTKERFEVIFSSSNNSCKICQSPLFIASKKNHPCVDHCHSTGIIRGILCNNCNSAMHSFLCEDSLKRMLDYIKRGQFIFSNENSYQRYFDFPVQRKHSSKYLYGCSVENLNEMINWKDGKCHICEKQFISQRDVSVDHDHTTLKVRGVICNSCNTALSRFNEDATTITNAINYLQEHSSPST